MATAMERLRNQRVEQLMARDVVIVNEKSTMAEAAQGMRKYHVTGLPVVDKFQRCVGVLSATDFVESQSQNHTCCVATSRDRTGLQRAEVLDDELVKAHMSPNVQTIREHCSIANAGQMMCQTHIHRLVVVDRKGKPVGTISSLDLVSALVNSTEELVSL